MVLVTDVYEFEQIIGEGSFSNVVLATHNETQVQYAIKIIDKSKIVTTVQRERADREIAILKTCTHPNIVKLVETFESDDEISLVMELMSGGDLFDRITKKGVFPENEARKVMRSVMSALDFLHDRHLVHRDLKPENLLYSSKDQNAHLKLSDFGLSKFSNEKDNDGLVTPCGTIAYAAPEITHCKVYRKGVDVWSCGCILYFMLFGRPPFYSESEEEIYDLVSQGIWSFPESQVSEQAKDMVRLFLETDPNKRISAKQAMQHPFIAQRETPPLSRRPTPLLRTSSEVPQFVFTPSPTTAPTSSSLSLSLAQPPMSPSSAPRTPTAAFSPSMTHPPMSPTSGPHTPILTPPLSIPTQQHLRASMQSAMDALRGPLTPPIVSPLESNIWKKRAKTRAMQTANDPSLSLNLTATPSSVNDDVINADNKISENDQTKDELTDVDMNLIYQG